MSLVPRTNLRPGFTLIELLVVVAIDGPSITFYFPGHHQPGNLRPCNRRYNWTVKAG